MNRRGSGQFRAAAVRGVGNSSKSLAHAEDTNVEKWKIDLKPENIRIVPVDKIFE